MKINFQNMCSLRKISCGLIFSMAISLVACGSDNDEEGGDNGDDGLVEDTSIPGNSIVTVKQNRNIILHNPLSNQKRYETCRLCHQYHQCRRIGKGFSLGSSSSVASSSGDGVRSCSCSKRAKALLILLSEPT